MSEVKIKALQVDTTCKPTKKGDPQVGIKYDKGWIKVSGGPVKDVQAGDVLVLNGEPTQFGKSWYGRLEKIERPNSATGTVASQAAGKVNLDEILDVIDKVLARLPTQWQESPQHPRACAQIINTIIMGIESGQILLEELEPDLPEPPEPPSDEDVPPWERR